MIYQVHFGANYETGEYGWTTELETVKRQIDWQLKELKTDYVITGTFTVWTLLLTGMLTGTMEFWISCWR